MTFLFKSRKQHPHSQHQSAQAAPVNHSEGSAAGSDRSNSSSKSNHHSRSRTTGPAVSGIQSLPQVQQQQQQQQLHTSRSDEQPFRLGEDNHQSQNFTQHHHSSSQNQLNLQQQQQQQQASPDKRSRGGSVSDSRVSFFILSPFLVRNQILILASFDFHSMFPRPYALQRCPPQDLYAIPGPNGASCFRR